MPNHHRRKNNNSAGGRANALKKVKATTPQSSSSVQSGPMTVDTIIENVIEMKEKLMFEECRTMLDKGIRKFSTSQRLFELLFLMGEVYLEMGDPTNSQHFLKQVVNLNPTHYPSIMYLGQISGGKESAQYFNIGLGLIKETLKTNNNDEIKQLYVQGLCSLCELYMTDLCFEENAEQECEKCVTMAKEFYNNVPINNWDINLLQTIAHLNMCQCKPEDGKNIMQIVAQRVIDEGNRLKESTNSTYSDLVMGYDFKLSTAKNLIELQLHQEAKTILEQLKDQYDEVVDLWYLLGICIDSLGQTDMAIKHLEKALSVGKKVGEDGLFLKEIQEDLNAMKQKLGGVVPDDIIDENDDDWEDAVEDFIDEDEEMNG